MNTAVIVQARLGSSRFPNKVLKYLWGKTVLEHVLERALAIGPKVILAVPNIPKSLWLSRIAWRAGKVETVFGAENDVLRRFMKAAREHHVDLIMRITADCPLLRPDLCREVFELYHETDASYAAIAENMTYPKGYGCEVFSFKTLELTHQIARAPYDREHVTPWMVDNLHCVYLTQEVDESHINYCVDTIEDLRRIRALKNKYRGNRIIAENWT